MALVKRSDRSLLDRPWRGIDRFFDELWQEPIGRFFGTPWFDSDTELMRWHPTTDIEETNDSFIVRLDLPGMNKKDIHVSLDNNVLTIWGERKREDGAREENYRVMERYYGKFRRTFALPSTVDANSVNAEFKDGVLVVDIKKKEEAKPKEIAIR